MERNALTIPELGHACESQLGINSPRLWFQCWNLTRFLLAALLLLSGTAKLLGSPNAVPTYANWLGMLPSIVALAYFELFISIWLMSGVAPHVAYALVAFFFACAGTYALTAVIQGQVACACFGPAKISPWIAVCIDAVALILLAASYREACRRSIAHHEPRTMTTGKSIVLASACLALLVSPKLFKAVAPETAARIRGDVLFLTSSTVIVGDGYPLDSKTVELEVSNTSSEPLQLLGGTATCKCVDWNALPAAVQPNSSQRIKVDIRFLGTPGRYRHRFILFTTSRQQPYLVGELIGRVVEPASETTRSAVSIPD